METKLEKYFYEKYPDLFINESKSMKETCMCWGIETGNGWMLLLDNLFWYIQNYIKNQHETVKWQQTYNDNKLKENPDAINNTPEYLKEKVPPIHFDQIKSKFGSLRVYYTGGDRNIDEAIRFSENLSRYICEECGTFDLTVGSSEGWITTLCEKCAIKKFGNEYKDSWYLFKNNEKIKNIFDQAMIDQKNNKEQEMTAAFQKIEEIKSRELNK